ncbi:MAG: alcohol dehydrogenase catalytic domain-containing protein [Bryobacteraceae bacterium]|nr:alcohol dehydrogenase catalytic domain-containing protein [Bryobacteraceae bacterium]
MTIAELVDIRRFRLVEGAPPAPGPGEVLARVEAVGICGSDLHNFMEGGIGDAVAVYPMVLGHEPTGVVVECGHGVTGWAPGDRVVLEPAIYCYHCEFCLSGRHNVCSNLRFMSVAPDPGYFRQFVTLPAANLLPLPAGMGFDEGTVFEPLAVALHSLTFADVKLGETVAVFGAGPIGLLTVAAVKLAGARMVLVVEPVAHRREMAKAMGADEVFDASEPVQAVLGATRGRGVDVAIDCAAKEDTINQCLHVTRNAGRVVITGIPSEVKIPLEFHVLRRKEIRFYNVRRSNHTSELALELMAEKPHLFAPLVTHARGLDDVQGAFELLERYGDGVGKIVLRPQGGVSM